MALNETATLTGVASSALLGVTTEEEQKMKKWEIWMSGYLATGMEGIPEKARKIGEVETETFQEACDILCSPKDWQDRFGNYNREQLTVWGCGLYDNEEDARRQFG